VGEEEEARVRAGEQIHVPASRLIYGPLAARSLCISEKTASEVRKPSLEQPDQLGLQVLGLSHLMLRQGDASRDLQPYIQVGGQRQLFELYGKCAASLQAPRQPLVSVVSEKSGEQATRGFLRNLALGGKGYHAQMLLWKIGLSSSACRLVWLFMPLEPGEMSDEPIHTTEILASLSVLLK
jgi:hypothetical protein